MAKPSRKLDDALRRYLRELGARGGTAAAGRGGKKLWADVPADERSRRMRALVKKRWANAKKKTRAGRGQ